MSNKLYLLTQDKNTGYDTYDSVIVCAPDEESARRTHPVEYPDMRKRWDEPDGPELAFKTYEEFVKYSWEDEYSGWVASPKDVHVKYLGIADDSIPVGVVISSYNAG